MRLMDHEELLGKIGQPEDWRWYRYKEWYLPGSANLHEMNIKTFRREEVIGEFGNSKAECIEKLWKTIKKQLWGIIVYGD